MDKKMKPEYKCILIDSAKKTIKEIVVEDNIKKMKAVLGCDSVIVKVVNEKYDLVIDEFYWSKIESRVQLFKILDLPQPYAGKAILLQKNNGGTYCNNDLSKIEMREVITFFKLFDYNYEAKIKNKKELSTKQ